MKYATIDETVWPVDDDGTAQWICRYGLPDDIVGLRFQLASVLASYAYLTDPTITQTTAIAALKRARRAAVLDSSDEV